MAIRKIVKVGDPILRKTSRPVEEITPRIRRLVEDMIETMRDANGCGLAAVSKAGETLVKATADFDFYCEHSTEFELLIEHDKA